jgi:hypothetical protein
MASAWITALSADDAQLDWTVLRRVKEEWVVADQGTLPLAADAATGAPADGPVPSPADLKAFVRRIRGPLVLAIPTRRAILHAALLPSGDPDELRGMADLQIDRFSPYPVDQLVLSTETLAAKEDSSLVAMAAIRREDLDAVAAPFQTARVPPDAIDVAALAWWRLLKDANLVPPRETRLHFLLRPGHAECIVSRDGLPLLFLSFPPAPDGEDDAAAWAADIADEAAYALVTAEADWGSLGKPSACVYADAPAEPAARRLLDALGAATPLLSAETKPLSSSLPPLSEGIARRAAGPAAPLALDLAPDDWRAAETERRTRRTLLRAGAAFLAVWVLCLAAFFTALHVRRANLDALRRRVEALETPALDVRRTLGKLAEWNLYADRSRSALETLRAVAVAMPGRMELGSFIYRKGATLSLRGEAESADPVYAFIKNLEASGLFTEVQNEGVTTRTTATGTVNPFGVTATLPPAGNEGKERAP